MSTAISSNLQSRLTSVAPNRDRSAIVSLTGMPGTGKSAWALSACTAGDFGRKYKPVYIPMDRKPVGEYIAQLLDSGRVLQPKTNFKANLKTASQAAGSKLWDEFEKLNEDMLKEPSLNPIIWDTATYAWAMCRLAKLGKLTQVMPHHYAQANTPFEALLLLAEEHGKIIVAIDRKSKEYKTGKDGKEGWTGGYDRAGYSHMGYVANVLLENYLTDEGGFGMRVIQDKITPSMNGAVMEGDECTFGMWAWKVFGEPAGEDLVPGYLG